LSFENGVTLMFTTNTDVVDWQWALNENGKDPYLTGGSTGGTHLGSGPALLEDCVFENISHSALSLVFSADITVDSCLFKDIGRAILTDDGNINRIVLTNSVIDNPEVTGIELQRYIPQAMVNNCDLSGGEYGVIRCREPFECGGTGTLDMTNNYWGTSDPDSIQNLIFDRNDNEGACYYVDFEPFHDESTPNQNTSFGGMKALFR
jgi:hypothetical protein